MKRGRIGFVLVVLLLAGCATADGETRLKGEIAVFGDLPEFRSPVQFPGEVTGIDISPFGAPVMTGNEICLHIDEGVLADPLPSGLPVEITANLRLLERDEIEIRRDDDTGQTVYCVAPLLEIGPNTIDIDVNTRDGLQVYQYNFNGTRITGWRPLTMYPGDFVGMAFVSGQEYMMQMTGETVCWLTNERVIAQDMSLASMLDVRLGDQTLEPEWINPQSQSGYIETCFILDLEPGEYPMSATLETLDIRAGEVRPVAVEEWYRWTLRVDESM